MKFGRYTGGSLQMLRNGEWYSYDNDCQWMSFDALKVVHRVTPVETGARKLVETPLLSTPLPSWIYLYEPLPAKMRRLTTPSHVMNLNSEPGRTQDHGSRQLAHMLRYTVITWTTMSTCGMISQFQA